ncbi:MAG: polysaccharide deacetylase family protein [Actinomycetes bacterium]
MGADEVVAAAGRGRRLPRRALWVTFDDGNPGTFRAAADLAAAGVSATAFVCPGVVDTREPLWWQVVDEAIRRNVLPTVMHRGDLTRFRSSLKRAPDSARRRAVDACREALNSQVPGGFQVAQATTGDLETWLGHGHHLGNHTWDHPLLDRCPKEEQKRQIATAHDWLRERFPSQPPVFAYPNGNRTLYAEGIAASLGYDVRTLFDHRVAASNLGAQAVSRVRIDADAPLARFRAIASGAHPLTFALSHR